MDEDGNFTGFGTTYVSVSSIDEHEMIVILADEIRCGWKQIEYATSQIHAPSKDR